MGLIQAHASTLIFTFSSPAGALSTSQEYTQSGVTITAYGYFGTANNSSNTLTPLYGKTGGGDENGLGIANYDDDYEIQTDDFVQFDFSYAQQTFQIASAQFQMGSVGPSQPGEGWKVYGSDTLGQIGTLVTEGTDENLDGIPGFTTYQYYAFTGWNANGLTPAADTLVCEITMPTNSTPAPEPVTLMLSGAGLIGLALARLRRTGKRQR